jgi:hypothetical protein
MGVPERRDSDTITLRRPKSNLGTKMNDETPGEQYDPDPDWTDYEKGGQPVRYYDKALFDCARKLRKEVPLGVPLKIQTTKAIRGHEDRVLADCTPYISGASLSGFRIRIMRGQSLDAAIDCLIHEYAHALDYKQQPNGRLDHRESWGRFYAKCYQIAKGKH